MHTNTKIVPECKGDHKVPWRAPLVCGVHC